MEAVLKFKRGEGPTASLGFFNASLHSFLITFITAPVRSTGAQWEGPLTSYGPSLHRRDEKLLNQFRDFFDNDLIQGGKIGTIGRESQDVVYFRVSSLKQIITCVLPHLDKYP